MGKARKEEEVVRREMVGASASACEDGDLMFYFPVKMLKKYNIFPSHESAYKYVPRVVEPFDSTRERTIEFTPEPTTREAKGRVALQLHDGKKTCVIQVQSKKIGKFKKLDVENVRAWVHIDGTIEVSFPMGLTRRGSKKTVAEEARPVSFKKKREPTLEEAFSEYNSQPYPDKKTPKKAPRRKPQGKDSPAFKVAQGINATLCSFHPDEWLAILDWLDWFYRKA